MARGPAAAPRLALALLFCARAPAVHAFDTLRVGELALIPTFQTIVTFQHSEGINYGVGALDSPGETERDVSYLVAKPKVDLLLPLASAMPGGKAEAYGAVSVVAATTQLDGEISGQVARAGDWAVDTDHAYLGLRNEVLDLSVGGQEFTVGDGFVIGDGNFNQGGENGQYWSGAFLSWRNSAVLKVNTKPVRGDVFWLRADTDFKDARVVGVNLETTTEERFGSLGLMWMEVIQGGAFNYDGMEVVNVRGRGMHLPSFPALRLYGEWVRQLGNDDQAGGRPNDATGWYLEGEYTLPRLPWTTRLSYRYTWLSGDRPETVENEEYRGLFFTIFRRDWDTFYQGEIAGEYHLFNQNQVTQMLKLKTFPRPDWALGLWYYHHALEQPHYFATQLTERNWADEVNVGVEHFMAKRYYTYLGFAWSTPNAAARQVFGDEEFWVVQTYLSYTF